ncbi:SDR family NAD(P)-dependent oxidoreductase [Actinospica durhamensis]|uniref:SDR family NAD(P)-dependent oxidoreductase n=1 Tax=Actinospica durhamensis TaxID=1508375 RepID=A0A941ILX5_9ACTN|nr:type I polyketide synthase [Actinospica durhamensis]MBR7833505.1 SDR family NAD(P)-dependent oxidoreductase [Actinospica durhamensis]
MAGEDELRDYLRRAALDLADARRRLAEQDARQHEPIAVVGMACRFPDAPDPEAYWELLHDGRRAAIGDVPPERFNHDPRSADNDLYTPRRGAFLPDVAGWDAGFFGFSAREALRMDPQQRLLMELAWEAMEDAGTPPASLSGSRTGVLLGFSDAFQYGQLETERHGQRVYADPYMGQGSLASVVAGRLAYHFDLRGPTFSLDTACSSSLVAVHLAVQALRNRECDQALVGGAYLALHQFLYIHSCATSMLSPTDGCKTFDSAADGYLMGEGGGMVMLARLSDALRDGRRIRAVIRGSAVNQDGRSNGLTAPNRAAQVEVIRQALHAAGATPDEVDYVEAHGSGTALGDDIELTALQDVFGARAADRPLHVGAVKTNLGHTHTAAGIAGLIKSVLVLEHGVVPANQNMTEPVEVLAHCPALRPAGGTTPLPADGRPAIAGVSSFGWSGTNAHVVLETAPATAPEPESAVEDALPADLPLLLPISAADDAALRQSLTRLADGIGTAPLRDVAHTLQSGRAQHRHRRAVVASDAAGAAARLNEAASTGSRSVAGRPRVAFLLPGVGDQYRGLARSLYRTEPVFAAAIDTCAAVLADECGVDILPLLLADPPSGQAESLVFPGRGQSAPAVDEDPLSRAQTAHPFLFSVEYALAKLLGHRGVTPDVLVGYSLGEYVAACLAGVFTLADALRVVTERARLIESAPEGRMLAVAAAEQAVRTALADCAAQVDVAAVNGPGMTVLSGAPDDIDAAVGHLTAAGIPGRVLRSAHPFHSTLLSPAQDRLAALIAAVPRRAPAIPIVSNATGRQLTDEQATDPQYWAQHLCRPVRFAQSVLTCADRGVDAYVELGPGQVLGSLVRQNLAHADTQVDVLGTLPAPWAAHGDREEAAALLETCGRLWELGTPLDWSALAPQGGTLVGLPGYPFQRTRYWPESETSETSGASGTSGTSRGVDLPATGTAYAPVWRPDHKRPAAAAPLTGTLVVFGHETGIGPELANLAEAAGLTVLEVVPGNGFRREGRRIVIDPASVAHYKELAGAALAAEPAGEGPLYVAHLWSLDAATPAGAFAGDEELRAAVRYGFDSLLTTVQALSDSGVIRELRLLTVTAGSTEITGGDCTSPVQALAHGFGRSVRKEHRDLAWRGVDLHPDADPRQAAGELVQELRRDPWKYADPAAEPALVGWREGRRWLESWTELPVDESCADAWDLDGAYLITGGTCGLGMALAKDLVRRGVRRLALVARTPIDRDGPDPTGRQARMLRDVAELEAAGAQVLLLTADAGVPGELRAALRKAREHFGTLYGVVHAAGVPGGGWAQRQTPAGALEVLAPKVLAMGPLAELVGPDTAPDARPKLLVLYSSVITALGDLGQSDYCAANSVLDAYGTALAAAAPDTQVLTVAWGQWQHDAWQRPTAGDELAEQVAYRERYGFTDAGGCAQLDRLVGAAGGSVLAMRQPLPEAHREWARLSDLDAVLVPALRKNTNARFPRPPQRTGYLAPRSALETAIAEVWGEFLGIDAVGVNDPFFDLGGNSLVGVAMVTAIERQLERRIAPALLFAHPTVASFAAALDPSGDGGPAAGTASPSASTSGSARGARRRLGAAQTAGTRK